MDDFLSVSFEEETTPTPTPSSSGDPARKNLVALDEELDSIFGFGQGAPTSPPDFVTRADLIRNNQRESPVDDLLGLTPSTTGAPTPSTAVKPSVSDSDFLAWLDESPVSVKRSAVEVSPPVNTDAIASEDNNTDTMTLSSDTASLDDIFVKEKATSPFLPSEVLFVEPEGLSPFSAQAIPALVDLLGDRLIPVTTPARATSSPGPPKGGASSSPASVDITLHALVTSDLEAQMATIVHSSFPDVPKLRSLAFEGGFVPSAIRCKVWSIILTGLCTEYDHEAADFTCTQWAIQASSSDAEFVERVKADCRAILASSPDGATDLSLLAAIEDLVVLYFKRRDIAGYVPLVAHILAPLALTAPRPLNKALLSSCLHALTANFTPLVSLEPNARDLALSTIHFWQRLLINYHTPSVVVHLDRVFPGWTVMDFTEDNDIETSSQNIIPVDPLEHELGLDSLDNPFGWSSAHLSTQPVVRPPPISIEDSKRTQQPNIDPSMSLRWIAGLFSGCMPLELSAVVFDWAIATSDRYAGVYLTAALCEIFGDKLCAMDSVAVKAWFKSIFTGRDEWFKLLGDSTEEMTWNSFVSGWLYAAEAIRSKTPLAFRNSFADIEDWARERAAQQRRQQQPTTTSATSASQAETPTNAPSSNFAVSGGDDEDEDDFFSPTAFTTRTATPAALPATAKAAVKREGGEILNADDDADKRLFTGGSGNLMAKFRRLSMQFKGDTTVGNSSLLATNSLESSASRSKDYSSAMQLDLLLHKQDVMVEGKTMCIWADPTEVVPCLTSTARRLSGASKSPITYFHEGLQASVCSRGKDHHCFPYPALISPSDTPFFFGIDCRAESERALGDFPRAFRLDPALLSDSDEVTKLLETLEPLSSSVHFCIYGVGPEYYHWHQLHENSAGTAPNVSVYLEPQREVAKLNAVATFFMKRSFKNVSILDGGFVAAVKHLHAAKSTIGLSESLIDMDAELLFPLLGIASPKTVGTSSLISNADAISTSSQPLGSTAAAISSGNNLNKKNTEHDSGTGNNNGTAANSAQSLGSFFSSFQSVTSNILKQPSQSAGVVAAANGLASTSTESNNNNNASDFTRKLSMFGSATFDTLKKSVSAAVTAAQTAPSVGANDSQATKTSLGARFVHVKGDDPPIPVGAFETQSAFVIDGDDDDEDGDYNEEGNSGLDNNFEVGADSYGPPSAISETNALGSPQQSKQRLPRSPTSHGVSIRRTDIERAQALALHKMAGLRKGDEISINKEYLPGAVLFPSLKNKVRSSNEGDTAAIDGSSEAVTEQVHRYLVVTKERFLVLDANGGGVGSKAVVKSNHHLTELTKMTFRKRDPELITLFLMNPGNPDKSHQYRITRRQDFVEILQKNMMKFK